MIRCGDCGGFVVNEVFIHYFGCPVPKIYQVELRIASSDKCISLEEDFMRSWNEGKK